jgi:uncharacterized protein YejL (UPF0352 family)
MSMNGFPTLTLRMQGMEYSVIHALVEHHEEIEAETERLLKQALEGNAIQNIVRESIAPIIRKTLADAVQSAVHKALWSKEVKSILETDVHLAMVKVLKEYYPHSEPGKDYE